MTQSFTGSPFDVANLSYERFVDDGRLDPPPGGWVNGLARWQEDIISTQAHEWTGTFINNNDSPQGEQVAGYFQLNNGDHAGWGAALVAQATGSGSGNTVTAEFDSAHAAVNLNLVATGGDTGAAIRIDAWSGAHIGAGIEITAKTDAAIVLHGTDPQMWIVNMDQHVGIGVADMHLIGVSGLGTDHQHASVIA